MSRVLFNAALDAAQDWHSAVPEMQAFCDWPNDLKYTDRPAVSQPVIAHIQADPGAAIAESIPLRDALVALAPHVEWRLSYTEKEVGADFLQRYGWFELAGPEGHFLSQSVRMTVGYWGGKLDYGHHQHAPEELYTVVAGCADFIADGMPTLLLGPAGTRLHQSNQPHAMQTKDQPILTFVLWRGSELDDTPRMTAT